MNTIFTNEKEILFNYALFTSQKNKKILLFIRLLFSCFFSKGKVYGEAHKFSFFNSALRKDHIALFDSIYDTCEFDKGYLKWSYKRTVNFRNILFWFFYLTHIKELKCLSIPEDSIHYTVGFIQMTFLERLLLYTKLIINKGLKESIKRYDWENIKFLVTLYDAGEPEHFLVEEAKKHGVKTVVCQHGIFLYYFDHSFINTYNIWNIPSEYILAWGKATVDLLKKYSPETKDIICGNPRDEHIASESDNEVIGIAMGIPDDREHNQQMINIIENYAKLKAKKVWIRLHPLDEKSNYVIDEIISSFNRDIDKAALIITHITAMTFIYLAYGKKVMRFTGDELYYNLPEEICFNTKEDFIDKINKIDSVNYKEIAKNHIEFVGSESKQRYNEAFRLLNNSI